MTPRKAAPHLPVPRFLGEDAPQERRALMLIATMGVAIFLALPLATGNLHFVIDDWDFMQVPFFNGWLESFIAILHRKMRIGRELFWALEVKLFGVNRFAMHYVSMVFHSANALLFYACVRRSFPDRPALALATLPLSFSLAPLVGFTYIAQEGMRIAPFLAFLAILALQSWMKTFRWGWLVFAGLCYLTAQTIYESTVLFLALFPLFAFSPIVLAKGTGVANRADLVVLAKMAGALTLIFTALIAYRYFFGVGDKARGFHDLPDARDLARTVQSIWFYLTSPFARPPLDGVSITVGTVFALASLAMFALFEGDARGRPSPAATVREIALAALLGLGLLVLGLIPYVLAGVFGSEDWAFDERLLSVGGYGIILLIAMLYAHARPAWARRVAALALSITAGVWLAFGYGLRVDWRDAADRHCRMWTSLLEQVPEVRENTVFLFHNLNLGSDRALVFGGADSLMVVIKMLYRKPGKSKKIDAFMIHGPEQPEQFFARVVPEGFSNAFSDYHFGKPVPHERLILVRRHDDRLEVEDRFSPDDGTAISWRERHELVTERANILPSRDGAAGIRERLGKISIACDARS